jgi:hypothetical protein
MKQVLLFSFTAMVNPTLVAATTVMLLLPDPRRLMLGYLLGAMLMSITIGLVIVFALDDSRSVSTAKHTVSPAVDLAIGSIFLIIAAVLGTGRDKRLRERRTERRDGGDAKPEKVPRWQRALGTGSPRVTFAVGALLTLPGASYLAALGGVNKLDPGTAVTVLLVVMVNVIMLTLIELPLVSYALAPDWTPSAVARTKAWFGRHVRTIAVFGLAALGSLLLVRALITVVS